MLSHSWNRVCCICYSTSKENSGIVGIKGKQQNTDLIKTGVAYLSEGKTEEDTRQVSSNEKSEKSRQRISAFYQGYIYARTAQKGGPISAAAQKRAVALYFTCFWPINMGRYPCTSDMKKKPENQNLFFINKSIQTTKKPRRINLALYSNLCSKLQANPYL